MKIESKNNLQPKQYLSNKFRDITLNRNPKIYRPSSEPFISGDTLRKKSTHIFDETKTLNPRKVNKNDIVFIKTELKDIYFKNYHSKIENLICSRRCGWLGSIGAITRLLLGTRVRIVGKRGHCCA